MQYYKWLSDYIEYASTSLYDCKQTLSPSTNVLSYFEANFFF